MKPVVLLILVLSCVLCVALWAAGSIWFSNPEVELGLHGTLALIAAVVAILVVGGGLMMLSFYSARHGYDDDVGQ